MSRYFRAGTLHIGDKNVKDWKYLTILPGWFPASNLRLEAESTAALLQRRKNRVTVVMQLRIILLGGTAMTIGNVIAENRKDLNMTQEALAQKLGVTNQAVSKWELDQACPDIQLLPLLADSLGITIDELFGREPAARRTEVPWEDDNVLRIVAYQGHKLMKYCPAAETLNVEYTGPALDIECAGSISCGDVAGNVEAGGSVNCGNVGGDVDAGSGVACGNVEGSVDAGSHVTCGNVGGDVDAGSHVTCGSVAGDVDAGGTVFVGK